MAGAVLTPLLLPWLPGRAFSLKGLLMGLLTAALLLVSRWGDLGAWEARLEILAWCLLALAVTTYLAMNFTGASTYTSLSGVKKEMRWALPLEIGICFAGLALWVSASNDLSEGCGFAGHGAGQVCGVWNVSPRLPPCRICPEQWHGRDPEPRRMHRMRGLFHELSCVCHQREAWGGLRCCGHQYSIGKKRRFMLLYYRVT